jgi:hypothetical protein
MKRRVLIAAAIALLVLGCVAKWAYESRRLSRYRQAIETRYSPAIALIENASRSLPSREDTSEDAWTKKQSMMGEIERSLSAPEIVAAGWTSDGHHGSETLRPWNAPGYSTGSLFRASDSDGRHIVRHGKTFDGKQLVIFHGIVPDGMKRHYDIAILRDALDSQ